jgi:hypothetical protein
MPDNLRLRFCHESDQVEEIIGTVILCLWRMNVFNQLQFRTFLHFISLDSQFNVGEIQNERC